MYNKKDTPLMRLCSSNHKRELTHRDINETSVLERDLDPRARVAVAQPEPPEGYIYVLPNTADEVLATWDFGLWTTGFGNTGQGVALVAPYIEDKPNDSEPTMGLIHLSSPNKKIEADAFIKNLRLVDMNVISGTITRLPRSSLKFWTKKPTYIENQLRLAFPKASFTIRELKKDQNVALYIDEKGKVHLEPHVL